MLNRCGHSRMCKYIAQVGGLDSPGICSYYFATTPSTHSYNPMECVLWSINRREITTGSVLNWASTVQLVLAKRDGSHEAVQSHSEIHWAPVLTGITPVGRPSGKMPGFFFTWKEWWLAGMAPYWVTDSYQQVGQFTSALEGTRLGDW